MAELGKAYVQIVPSAKGISGSISQALGGEAVSAGKSAGESTGQSLAGSLVGVLKGALAAAGIGAAIKSSLDAGGALQQSFGGLDTLYGEASGKAKDFAVQAASAGISANSWAEQAVSFGAALKQSLGGDATAAAETANRAILDMADNSAKMGTDIGSIQNAYQGFAKQNYTMLDNLKLGYGGTKTEMERLIADAAQMTDVQDKLGLSVEAGNMSFANIANAISVVQENLGIAGVAAEEASTTFTGSFAAMKSAFTNLLADMSLGNDITNSLTTLVGSIKAFVMNNLIPMLVNIVTSIPKAIISNLPAIKEGFVSVIDGAENFLNKELPNIASQIGNMFSNVAVALPDITNSITTWINNFSQKVSQGMPILLSNLTQSIVEMFNSLMATLPTILSSSISIGQSILNFITTNLPIFIQNLGAMIPPIISGVVAFIIDSLPMVLDAVMNVLLQLPQLISDLISSLFPMIIDLLASLLPQIPTLVCTVIFEILPKILAFIVELGVNIISAVLSLLVNLIATIVEKLPEILVACVAFMGNLIAGIITGGIELVNTVIQLIKNVIDAITGTFTQFVTKGKEMIVNLATGIPKGLSDAVSAIKKIIDGIIEKVTKTNWLNTGINIVKGIGQGIVNGALNVVDAIKKVCSKALDAVKNFFGIHSPSKVMADEVGKFIPAGIAVGIEDNLSPITEAMQDVERQANASISANVQSATNSGYNSLKSGLNGTTNQMGDISINVYGSDNQSPKELALAVEDLINTRIRQKGMAFA